MIQHICVKLFEAFEAGTLEAEKRELVGRRKALELSAIDREMLSGLVDDFEKVMAEGTNP